MYINPGTLNKKIQIVQYKETSYDKDGFPAQPEKVVIRECFAKVTNTTGRENIKANSEFSEVKKRFLIRFAPAQINTDMVIVYDGKEYDIEYINDYYDNHQYMEILTDMKERV